MLFVKIGCLVLSVLIYSCSTNLSVLNEERQTRDDALTSQYSVLFIIHGDNNYLYHDSSGNEYKANEEALAGAIRVAEENPYAEVFIFHQKPRSHFLFFFPLRDGEFYYYRNGRLIENELYWRDQEQSNFDLEVDLYNQFRLKNQNKMSRMFIYLGHEIPEFDAAGYDESYPERIFTADNLAKGFKGFTSDSLNFDLLILSTCFGGTPYTIGKLGSYTNTIIASPENLHLSYFDLHALERLDITLQDGDVRSFAKTFAQQSFDKLTSSLQTVVSVAVYNIESVQNYLNSIKNEYNSKLISLKDKTQSNLATMERCDCADVPVYQLSTMSEGVHVFYRSANFGRSKDKVNHSGWECWK
jgi:hypothetical protein